MSLLRWDIVGVVGGVGVVGPHEAPNKIDGFHLICTKPTLSSP